MIKALVNWLLYKTNKPTDNITNIEELKIVDIYDNKYNFKKVTCFYDNISDYINKLKIITTFINDDKHIPTIYVKGNLKIITIVEFFSDDKHFLDADEYFTEFKKVCLQFISAYNSLDDKTKYGEINKIRTTIIYNNIFVIFGELSNDD